MTVRRVLLAVSVVTMVFGAAAAPAHAARGIIVVKPAAGGTVRDGCTNAKILNLAVTVTKPDGSTILPDKIGPGSFTFATLPAGDVTLQVSAPGYAPLGDPAAPGVTIAKPPNPNLPAPQQMELGLKAAILLAPNPMPTSCPRAVKKPPNPNAFAATVRDATTRAKVPNLAVTVTSPPGPPSVPDKIGPGTFTFKTLPAVQDIFLQVTAPGYAPLGDPAAPGVTIAKPPTPNLPAVQHMSVGIVAKLVL